MTKGPSITVAGAGAFGLTSALRLAEAGAKVRVFDPAQDQSNASGVAAGMLAPGFEVALDPSARAHLDLLMAGRNLWPDLERRLGLVIDRSGAAAIGGPDFLHRAAMGLKGAGLHAGDLPVRALRTMAPGLGPTFTEAVYSREDWRIDAAASLKALRRAAEALGVEFVRAEAQGFEGADWLVIATGAAQGLSVLAPALGKLTPIKGQILRLSSAYPGITLRAEGGYVVPDAGGMAVGATMEPGRRDLEVEAEVLAPLHILATALFPDASMGEVRVQTGIRAATPDGLPMVGRDRHPNVILATGARRNGWLLAPLVAQIVTACITEGEAGPYATRLDPRRFGT